MTRLEQALVHLNLARTYTSGVLSDIPDKDWFWMPSPSVTHIAWQVGHLASAQYHLTMGRIRGNRPAEDRPLFPVDNFVELFGRTSKPMADPQKYPSPAELRASLDRMTEQMKKELTTLTDEQLDEPADPSKPHPVVTTKLSSLLWCAHHEFLHTGQIALLRRMLGAEPMW